MAAGSTREPAGSPRIHPVVIMYPVGNPWKRGLDRGEQLIKRRNAQGAEFSRCRKYRYALWREWDESKPLVLFIGLNPSTADERENDPTIRRCIDYARRWGFGGLYMANLFAYCASYPNVLKAAEDPVGPDNDRWIPELASEAALVVAVWGNDGRFKNRSVRIRKMLPDMQCLRMNKGGEPAHPLYQSKTATPIPMIDP